MTTPQPLAQEVASRAATMAQKTNMRLLGVIENMSGEIFGTGGGEALADQLGVPLLGTVPLDPQLRECGDRGEPLVLAEPDSEHGPDDRRARRADRGDAARAGRRVREVASARLVARAERATGGCGGGHLASATPRY